MGQLHRGPAKPVQSWTEEGSTPPSNVPTTAEINLWMTLLVDHFASKNSLMEPSG